MKYIFFDLDNTLCESKQPVDIRFLRDLEILNGHYKIFIISGAEYSRMLTQIPMAYTVYMPQNGNEVYEDKTLLWKNELTNKNEILEHIKTIADYSGIEITDDMIDDRGAQISFSFVGHHADKELKKSFDPDRKKRISVLDKFPFPNAVIGGTTCIDYIPHTKGENIKRYIDKKKIRPYQCLYLGDAFMNYGNDATVLGVIPCHWVRSPLETQEFIRQFLCYKEFSMKGADLEISCTAM